MGLHVMTNEIHADFGGFPVEVFSAPAPPPETDDGTREIQFEAGERDDGAVGSRLVIRGETSQIVAMLRTALSYVEPQPDYMPTDGK